ncbi:MAG: porin [Gammaproteobacteria bacterium]
MKKQALAIAIASALAAPSAFAAQDTSGMQYTSAAEGFYASLRAHLDFSSGTNDADINAGTSRIGLRGTNDLGGGLAGFYQWEARATFSGSSPLDQVRLGHVGLRGNFGEFVVGRFWSNDYNWTHSSTDVANVYSGYLNYTDQRGGRVGEAIQYTTPDLNGFQGAILVRMGGDNSDDRSDPADPMTNEYNSVVNGARADNDLDNWTLAGTYTVQGFTVAGSYSTEIDGLVASNAEDSNGATAGGMTAASTTDLTSWTVRLGYAQDNWYVNGWYGEDALSEGVTYSADVVDTSSNADTNRAAANVALADRELISVAGGVALDKVNVYALYETRELGMVEDTYGTVGVQYSLGSNSRVWIEYWSRDLDSDTTAEDLVNLGLRHDF